MANNPSTCKVQMTFFDFGLEYVWKMVAALPTQTLITFCPVMVTIGMKQYTDSKKVVHHHNNPEHGICGIHLGVP
jgi:hypothetical protein